MSSAPTLMTTPMPQQVRGYELEAYPKHNALLRGLLGESLIVAVASADSQEPAAAPGLAGTVAGDVSLCHWLPFLFPHPRFPLFQLRGWLVERDLLPSVYEHGLGELGVTDLATLARLAALTGFDFKEELVAVGVRRAQAFIFASCFARWTETGQ